MSKVVLLASAPVVEGATIKSIALQHGVDIASVHVVSNAAFIANSTIQPGYDVAISISDSPTFHTAGYLSAVAKILKPGATLQIQQPDPSEGSSLDKLKHELVISGFTDAQAVGTVPGLVILRASLPAWGLGSKAALPLKAKKQPTEAVADAPVQKSAWKLAADDAEDDELVDDDELLTEADLQRPAAVSKPDDCEVGAGKKACANCSCGRAEAEAAGVKVELTQEMLDNPQSSCGNCSLGDAFRCASCPYKGLPAFETGKKIQLASSFLTADA